MKYITNNITDKNYSKIVTILEIDGEIEDGLKQIQIKSLSETKVILDISLHTGLDHRFLEVDIDHNGKLILDSLKCKDVDSKVINTANLILKRNAQHLNKLTEKQKKKITIQI